DRDWRRRSTTCRPPAPHRRRARCRSTPARHAAERAFPGASRSCSPARRDRTARAPRDRRRAAPRDRCRGWRRAWPWATSCWLFRIRTWANGDYRETAFPVRYSPNTLNLFRCLAPIPWRGPPATVEAEAVDRRRGGERAEAIEADAGPLEAALLQHPARGRIAHPRAGDEHVAAEIAEGMIDDRARGLGGVALAPVAHAEPIAEFGLGPVALVDPAGADDPATLRGDQEYGLAAGVGGGNEGPGVRQRIGMRDAQRVLGDPAVVGQHRDSLGVLEPRRSQGEPPGLDERNIPLCVDSIQQGHDVGTS